MQLLDLEIIGVQPVALDRSLGIGAVTNKAFLYRQLVDYTQATPGRYT